MTAASARQVAAGVRDRFMQGLQIGSQGRMVPEIQRGPRRCDDIARTRPEGSGL